MNIVRILILVLLSWLRWTISVAQQYVPVVNIGQGALRGKILKTSNGRDFYAFRGIPYATPPVGVFRFKEPNPHAGWGGVLDATDYRSQCPQIDFRGIQTGDEDCLFINVFTPTLPNFQASSQRSSVRLVTYPVMVFIHGRTFDSGASNIYGAEKLLDKGVVVVTFNYRLGALGFLSTGDEKASGNWGLLDQRMALGWIQNNIVRFGGDPKTVTLFGQGSGAVSVLLHIISPLGHSLFHRAILQSGSALCDWAIQLDPLSYAKNLATRLGCQTYNTENLVKCVREKPATSIVREQANMKEFGEFPAGALPVIDKNSASKFLPEHPQSLLEYGNFKAVPIIVGINKDEGAFFYPILTRMYKEDIQSTPGYFQNTLLPNFLRATTNLNNNLDVISQELIYRYYGGLDLSNPYSILEPFINMTTDGLYVACTEKTVQLYSRLNPSSTYMYTFEYKGTNSLADFQPNLGLPNSQQIDAGVSNGDELLYLFNVHIDGLRHPSHLDNMISNRVLTLWTDFAKLGKAPQYVNYEYPEWKNYHQDERAYYKIDRSLMLHHNYRTGVKDLWLKKLPEISTSINPTNSPLTQMQGVEPFYRTLAWAMVAICIALLVLVVVLLAILYNQKKSQSFKANHENQSRMSGSTLY